MAHPVQSVVESLYASGRCPRLHVNATLDGVVCPDFIREQWQERLIIDLDASYPLDLTFDEHGIGADLSFGGYVTRCTFPWTSIYVVADRATGHGIVLEQNMPESVLKSKQVAEERQGSTKLNVAGRPLRVAEDLDDDGAEVPRPDTAEEFPASAEPETDEPTAGTAAAPDETPAAARGEDSTAEDTTAPVESAPTPRAVPRKTSTSDADVAQRRAAFRVIDGGT